MRRPLTIGTLTAMGLLATVAGAAAPEQAPGADVFVRFCKLDSQGEQLTPDGWTRIASLFVNPETPRLDRIVVSDGGGTLGATPEGGKIAVGRDYTMLGQIDLPQLRFSAEDPGGIKIREIGLYVVKVPGSGGREEWRIEGRVPVPVLTVDAAIRYVSQMRASAKSRAVRKNADRTLASLKRLR